MASKRGAHLQAGSTSEKAGQVLTGIAAGTFVLAAIGLMRADWWFTTYIPNQWPGANWWMILAGALVGALLWVGAYYAIARLVGST
ncbi:MAG: hypothetical protein N3A60_01180, partial [Thermanaerothrix sp.]|nr:hypothetical protein [Thermanaerothrix sp.]